MTLRERFNRIMDSHKVDRLPYVELRNLFWVHRLRWVDQGAPQDINPFEYFGFDEASNDRATGWTNNGRGLERMEIDLYALPRFESKPKKEAGNYYYTYDIRTGVTLKRLKNPGTNVLGAKAACEPPVKNENDWDNYKRRFDPYTPERYPRVKRYDHHLRIYPLDYPQTWEQALAEMESRSHLLSIYLPTGYNFVSNAVGPERLFELLLDEPEFIHKLADHFMWFAREASRKAVETAPLDFVDLDDDTPPRTVNGELLISPKMFMNYVGQSYQKNLEMVASSRTKLVKVPLTRNRAFDEKIISMVIDKGLRPILVADAEGEFSVKQMRKEYGKDFAIIGGMDTRILCKGRSEIDAMIDEVFSVAAEGGFVPLLMDRYGELLEVPFENYAYYTEAFRRANGML